MKKSLYVLGISLLFALIVTAPNSRSVSAQVPTLTATKTPTTDPYFGVCPTFPPGFDFSSLPLDYVARCSMCLPNTTTLTPAPTAIFPTIEIPTIVIGSDWLTEFPTATPVTYTPTSTITPTPMFTSTPAGYGGFSLVSKYTSSSNPPVEYISGSISCTPDVGSGWINAVECTGSLLGFDSYNTVNGHVYAEISIDSRATSGNVTYYYEMIGNLTSGISTSCKIDFVGYTDSTVCSGSISYPYNYNPMWRISLNSTGDQTYVGGDFIIRIRTYSNIASPTPSPTATVTPVYGFCSVIPDLSEYTPIVDTDGLVTVTPGACFTVLPEIDFEIPAVEPVWDGFNLSLQGIRVCPNYVTINSLRVGDVSIPDGMFAIGLAFLIYKLIF